MRILLDECLPKDLAGELHGHPDAAGLIVDQNPKIYFFLPRGRRVF
ncbi:MAG: hypothetical protein MUF81_03415 [Verrucomicrobia bacterium]|nr:hypothetical protein [Verrucomicrobiota bacterium]